MLNLNGFQVNLNDVYVIPKGSIVMCNFQMNMYLTEYLQGISYNLT